MEESSERRRERLRALREEASLASNVEERGGSCLAPSSDLTALPLPGDLQQAPVPASPSRRFEFYTDPLAAFSGSQKKKPKNSLGSPLSGGTAAAAAPPPPPSPFWQPDFNPIFCPTGNANTPGLPKSYPNLHSPHSLRTPGPPNPSTNANPHQYSRGNFPNPNAKSLSPKHPSISGKFTSPGSFSTPGSTDFNSKMALQGGYNYPGSSSRIPSSGFGSPQPFSASQMYDGIGPGSLNILAPNHYNQECSGSVTDSPSRHRSVGPYNGQNNGWTQNGMHSGRSPGSNHSRGSFMQSPGSFTQSPGSSGRGNRTPGRSGGRGFQRSSHDVSAITHPELFAKRSMLVDPWKDLMPVRFESVASRLNACSVTGSCDWLPKSASKGMASPSAKGINIAASGPSLAECLEASYVEAVVGEDGA